MASPRDEAIRALDHIVGRLHGDEPIEGLERFQLRATAEYARQQIEQIQEVKRARRTGSSDGVEPAPAAATS